MWRWLAGWLLNAEQLVEWELAGKAQVIGQNPPHFYFGHHKSQMTWPEKEQIDVTVLCNPSVTVWLLGVIELLQLVIIPSAVNTITFLLIMFSWICIQEPEDTDTYSGMSQNSSFSLWVRRDEICLKNSVLWPVTAKLIVLASVS
jgi:hypothetical protein